MKRNAKAAQSATLDGAGQERPLRRGSFAAMNSMESVKEALPGNYVLAPRLGAQPPAL